MQKMKGVENKAMKPGASNKTKAPPAPAKPKKGK